MASNRSARAGSRRPPRLSRRTDLVAFLAGLSPAARRAGVEMLSFHDRLGLDADWPSWAHPGQLPPVDRGGEWRCWVIMAGRGFGKTRAGSQWVANAVRGDAGGQSGPVKIALVGATIDEARRVMVEGVSGLLTVAAPWIAEWAPSRRLLRFANGSEATLFSGASPAALRGPEHHFAWCDELAKWERPQETWDMLQLGMRLGERPRVVVTTTPNGNSALRAIMAAPGCIVSGGATGANPHLPSAFVEAVTGLYGGTRLGAQEIEGRLVDPAGALWTRAMIEACRVFPPLPPEREGSIARAIEGEGLSGERYLTSVGEPTPLLRQTWPNFPPREPPRFERIAIGVDPPSGGGTCGIVVCARDAAGHGHVLADHSIGDCSPDAWARAVAEAASRYHCRGDDWPLVVAEANQGGRMVQTVLRTAGKNLRIKLVHARHGKAARAEPVALLFEQGRVSLHGQFPMLEAELLGFVAGEAYAGPGKSPDRADALVWALSELMTGPEHDPKIVAL